MLLLIGLSSSCQILRSDPNRPTYENGANSDTTQTVVKPDETNVPDKPVVEVPKFDQVEFHGEYFHVASRQEQFDVALILPFYFGANNDRSAATSNVMLHYYQGVKLALRELESRGLNLKLHVYDNVNDTSQTKKILDYSQMKKMDLIIGPIIESHLKIVSQFSRKHKIPVFSPFSKVDGLGQANSAFFSTIPSNELKAKRLVEFWEDNYVDHKLLILRDNGRMEKDFVPYLIEALKRSGKLLYSEVEYTTKLDWTTELSRTDENLIYIPSLNRKKVSSSMGKIFAAKRKVVVFGEQSWAQFEDNDYNFWSKMNVHLVANEFIDALDTNNFHFRRYFRAAYQEDPEVYSYMGYDQMSFIGEFLMAFGEHFPMYLEGRSFKYLGTTFEFGMENGFQQNHHLFFLKFEDYKLQRIQD